MRQIRLRPLAAFRRLDQNEKTESSFYMPTQASPVDCLRCSSSISVLQVLPESVDKLPEQDGMKRNRRRTVNP